MIDIGLKLGRKLLPSNMYTALQTFIGRKTRVFDQAYFKGIMMKYERTIDFKGKTVVEFGAGNEIATAVLMILSGAARVYLVDKVNVYTSHGSSFSPRYIEALLKAHCNRCEVDLDPIQIGSQITFMDSFFCDEVLPLIPNNTVDCVVSHTVLEHVENLEAIFRTARKILKLGGQFCGIVDLSDHTYHFLYRYKFLHKYIPYYRFKHLEYSDQTWALLNDSARLRMNRILVPDYRDTIMRCGFEINDIQLFRESQEYRFQPHRDVLGSHTSTENDIDRVSGFTLSAILVRPE